MYETLTNGSQMQKLNFCHVVRPLLHATNDTDPANASNKRF